MKEGERGPFFPKLRARIKDNNISPHGKFHRFYLHFLEISRTKPRLISHQSTSDHFLYKTALVLNYFSTHQHYNERTLPEQIVPVGLVLPWITNRTDMKDPAGIYIFLGVLFSTYSCVLNKPRRHSRWRVVVDVADVAVCLFRGLLLCSLAQDLLYHFMPQVWAIYAQLKAWTRQFFFNVATTYCALKHVLFVINYKVHTTYSDFKENDNTLKFTKHVSTETSVIFSWLIYKALEVEYISMCGL